MIRIYWQNIGVLVLLVFSIACARKNILDTYGVDLSSVQDDCKKLYYNPSVISDLFGVAGNHSFTLITMVALKQGHGVQDENAVVLNAMCLSLDPGSMEVAWGNEYKNVVHAQDYQWIPVNDSMLPMFELSITLQIHVVTTEHVRVTCMNNLTFSSLNYPQTFSLLLSHESYKGESEVRMKLDLEREADIEENANGIQTYKLCTQRFKPVSGDKDGGLARGKDESGEDMWITILLFIIVLICISSLVIMCSVELESARTNRQRQLRSGQAPVTDF